MKGFILYFENRNVNPFVCVLFVYTPVLSLGVLIQINVNQLKHTRIDEQLYTQYIQTKTDSFF